MKRIRGAVVLLLCTVLSLSLVSLAMAGQGAKKEKVEYFEGQIKSIKIDRCGMQPGSCEGSIVLAQAAGKGDVSLAIKPGTWLKRGDELVVIEELGVGNYIKAQATEIPGETGMFRRITILEATTP